MFRNLCTVFIRNLKKQKIYSLINIFGLAIGIAVCLTIAVFIYHELGYDAYNTKADRIYRVFVKTVMNGKSAPNAGTPSPLGPAMVRDFPEVETFTRIGHTGARVMTYHEKSFRENAIYWVDSSYFDVFTMTFLEGNSRTALVHPNTIVLTESAAKKYFGNESPVGKTLLSDDKGGYLVTGVVRDYPENSHFRCDMLGSIETYPMSHNKSWLELWFSTYIVLKPGADPVALQSKLEKAAFTYVGPQLEAVLGIRFDDFMKKGNLFGFFLQPLSSVYLQSGRTYEIDPNTQWAAVRTGDIAYVYIFGGVAGFILLIAIINFMNLTTARAERRAKEVGIRKTLGASRSGLVRQFMLESILMSGCAVVLALALLELFLPSFNALSGKQLSLNYLEHPSIIAMLVIFTIVLGVCAGMYPALVLSSFSPMRALNGHDGAQSRKSRLRNILVVLQFSISIALIISTIVIKNQLDFIQHKDLGFNKERLLIISEANNLEGRMNAFKNEALKDPHILSMTRSYRMFTTGVPGDGYLFNKKTGTDPLLFQFVKADENFLRTYQIPLASGRFFSREFPTDSMAVVVNQAALRAIGTRDVIGKELTQLGIAGKSKSYTIIGVMKDFHWESLHQSIRPLVVFLLPEKQSSKIITVRLQKDDVTGTIERLKKTWGNLTGGESFRYNFVDQDLARMYEAEEKTADIAIVVSLLAIFIACLGLFGLASFVTEQRVKEIGIRKVMGASVVEIALLLSGEFTKWVLIANAIAWPVAYYSMTAWLQNFAYRIDINVWIFIVSGVAALVIALATVSFQAVKAALANPIDSLRYE
jgi:putative ABC transport system permease protein